MNRSRRQRRHARAGGDETREFASLSASEKERVRELEARLDELPDDPDGVFEKEQQRIEEELQQLGGGA